MSEYTSIELSQRLAELGFKGEHEWWWVIDASPVNAVIRDIYVQANNIQAECPAFTFTEIWAVLPTELQDDYGLMLYKVADGTTWANYEYSYGDGYRVLENSHFSHKSPVEAAGLLLEWAIINKHVVCEEVDGGT